MRHLKVRFSGVILYLYQDIMAHKQFIRQLRTDSFYNIVIATSILAILVSIVSQFSTINQTYDLANFFWLILHITLPPLIGYWSWKFAEKERQEAGAQLLVGAYIILITFNVIVAETLDTPLAYFYGYFIVVSSTLIRPAASFSVWLWSLILFTGVLFYRETPLAAYLGLLTPMAINFFLAIGSWLTTIDWQEAVQTTSLLQRRAQRRRDELFGVQEELKQVNTRQTSLYRQLITSVGVGQRIAALLDLDDLLGQVVALIKNQLEFAYVGIFLLESGSFLVIRAEAGDELITHQARKRILMDENNTLSLTAAQRQDQVVNDIRTIQFETHPYLRTNTLSEIGLPLIVGDHLHGVLNIQSYGVNAFDDEILPILRSLANQVSIALHNAQLFNAAILARRDAEQANEIKSRFLASMSHELRTPLNAILNFTGFVADGVFGPINEEQADALEKTLDSGGHLLSLINDILDLAKVEAGAMDMFIQEIDMNGLLRGTVATATGLLKNKPIELILEIDKNLPYLYGDKRRLRQILLNLVSNAVKFTKDGQITIAAHRQGDLLQLCVQDTGIGIAPEDQELIFESFHQAENGVSSELGTGLGLPIAKYFVEAHGGRIWLESEVGQGTTFFVMLPFNTIDDKQPVSLARQRE